MTPLFTKLNLKGQTELLIINAPESLEPDLAALTGVAILRDPAEVGQAPFVLAFVTTQSQMDTLAQVVAETTGMLRLVCLSQGEFQAGSV